MSFLDTIEKWEIRGKESFKVNVKKHLMKKGLDKHNCEFHFYLDV